MLLGAVFAVGQSTPGGGWLVNSTVLPLRSVQDISVGSLWRVSRAQLYESGEATWGLLRIQNVSKNRIQWVRFYAEYFDSSGRLCFTLAFGGERHWDIKGEDARPIAPGEERVFVSDGVALGSATAPAEVRVHLIGQHIRGDSGSGLVGESKIRSPVTVNGTGIKPMLQLDLTQAQREAALLDLAFAMVTVGADGALEAVEVLGVINASVQRWMEDFLRYPDRFQAATAGLANHGDTALILIRSVRPSKLTEPRSFLPRHANWVMEYVRQDPKRELPPVTQFFFVESDESKLDDVEGRLRTENPAPIVVQFNSAGSSWSSFFIGRTWDTVSGGWVLRWRSTDAFPQ